MSDSLLASIESPADIRKLSVEELPHLAREVRDLIIETVSDKGGHLGAGLGVTDLTIALHYVLNTPDDFLVFDVGHQVQAHKILTGRRDGFRDSFRQYKGVSGLVNKSESVYDPFTTGHAGPSISAALGYAVAQKLKGEPRKVVAVIGDQSIANGMAFEALNHAGHIGEDLCVILNDNEMSISPSVGALNRYLNKLITNPTYNHLRDEVEKLVNRVPRVGKHMLSKIRHIEEGVKHLLVPGQLFEDMSFRYFGPLDGHNVTELAKTLPNILNLKGPKLIHVVTQKGKGMPMAEKDPVRWHASVPFDVETGQVKKKSSKKSYTKAFSDALIKVAEKDSRVTALTAGMPEGTGLQAFGQKFPERYFDVGISEEHGVTFCAGQAHAGLRPIAAIYSTFLQRGFDQIMHDVALQNLPVMFCLDRAGLVGEDGPTHHGSFDLSYLRQVPGMTLLAPRDGIELEVMMEAMVAHTDGPSAMRYPRGAVTELEYPELLEVPRAPFEIGKAELLKDGNDVALIAIGSMVGPALRAANLLAKEGVNASVINARSAKPLDEGLLGDKIQSSKAVITLEEGCLPGGFGAAILELITKKDWNSSKVVNLGLPDEFTEAGPRDILLDNIGLSPEKIARTALESLQRQQQSA